jgi:hypothetical protein
MLIHQLFREDAYTTSRTGAYVRIGVWFNGETGKQIDAHRKNHAEVVATEPHRFGISSAEMRAVRKHPDYELDWNGPVIQLANAHHWVRVKAEGQETKLELDLQSTNASDVLKAARYFANVLSPTVILVDLDVNDYNNVWYTRIEGDAMERYLKTGRLPSA